MSEINWAAMTDKVLPNDGKIENSPEKHREPRRIPWHKRQHGIGFLQGFLMGTTTGLAIALAIIWTIERLISIVR